MLDFSVLKSFKIKFAFLGALVVPMIMLINLHRTDVEIVPTLFIAPSLVGIAAGFFIGRMKDKWVKLNSDLELLVKERTKKMQEALAEVKILSGFLPICASCKKIRDNKGYWNQIEVYIESHSDAEFSHSVCPDCTKRLYPEFAARNEII